VPAYLFLPKLVTVPGEEGKSGEGAHKV
jgi:hypothetical protein